MIETLHSVLKPTRQTAYCSSSQWNDEKKKKESKSGITERCVLLQLYDCCHFVWNCVIINEIVVFSMSHQLRRKWFRLTVAES